MRHHAWIDSPTGRRLWSPAHMVLEQDTSICAHLSSVSLRAATPGVEDCNLAAARTPCATSCVNKWAGQCQCQGRRQHRLPVLHSDRRSRLAVALSMSPDVQLHGNPLCKGGWTSFPVAASLLALSSTRANCATKAKAQVGKAAQVRAFLSLRDPGPQQKPKSASMSPIF